MIPILEFSLSFETFKDLPHLLQLSRCHYIMIIEFWDESEFLQRTINTSMNFIQQKWLILIILRNFLQNVTRQWETCSIFCTHALTSCKPYLSEPQLTCCTVSIWLIPFYKAGLSFSIVSSLSLILVLLFQAIEVPPSRSNDWISIMLWLAGGKDNLVLHHSMALLASGRVISKNWWVRLREY